MKKITTLFFAIALSFSGFAQQTDTMFIHMNNPQFIHEIATADIDSIVFIRTEPRSELPPTITTTQANFPESEMGDAFDLLLQASGAPDIIWQHVAGTLPPGINFEFYPGRIFGTPILPGVYTFTLRAINTFGSDEREFTMTVALMDPVNITADFVCPAFLAEVRRVTQIDEPNPIYNTDVWNIEEFIINTAWSVNITSIAGIEHFIGLRDFRINANQVNSANLSSNVLLETLLFNNNPITTIDISPLVNLRYVNFSGSDLESLDVSMLRQLGQLTVNQNNLTGINFGNVPMPSLHTLVVSHNRIRTFDGSKLPNLRILNMATQQHPRELTINLTNNPNLEWLYLQESGVSTIDLTHNTALIDLNVASNPLITSLNLSYNVNLEVIQASGLFTNHGTTADPDITGLEIMDLSNNPNIRSIDLNNNVAMHTVILPATRNYLQRFSAFAHTLGSGLTSLDISNAPLLAGTINLGGGHHNLASLNASNLPLVTNLNLTNTGFTSTDDINITGSNAITHLTLWAPLLTSINASAFPVSIVNLNLHSLARSLAELDISTLVNLTHLNVSTNSLTSLDLSNNTALVDLVASDNLLTGTLDLSNLPITRAWVQNNNLTGVNVTGTNLGQGLPPMFGQRLQVANNLMTDPNDIIGWRDLPNVMWIGGNSIGFWPQREATAPVPTIITTTSDIPTAVVGEPFDFMFEASHDGAWNVTWPGTNPASGLVLLGNGRLHGTPPAGAVGTWPFTMRITIGTNVVEKDFQITIDPAP